MSDHRYDTFDEPHAPDVELREELDSGFSRDFGFHFQPNEAYWVDCHNHLRSGRTFAELYRLLDEWYSRLDAYRLGKILVITPAVASDTNAADRDAAFDALGGVSRQDGRFGWIVRLPFDNPDIEMLEDAIDSGAAGLKLHNSDIMKGKGKHTVWLSDRWEKIFELVAKRGVPVLWHVTQRMSASPYHGGGESSYWKEGRENGVTCTNEDMLQVTLQLLRDHPRLKIVGAHQLHVGLDRLTELFDGYPNLYVDSSCGFYLRWGDTLYEKDRKTLQEFFRRYPDRILFGTDSPLAPGCIDEYLVQAFLCHIRFIKQLRLPDETLQNVSHLNAESVFNLKPLETGRRGTARP